MRMKEVGESAKPKLFDQVNHEDNSPAETVAHVTPQLAGEELRNARDISTSACFEDTALSAAV